MLAAALAVLSTVRLLLNRKIIEEPEHADTLQVWDALWPDVLLSIVTLAALRTFIARRPHRSIGASWRRIINVLSVVALFAYSVWVLTDRTLITMLVHIAIDGIEAAHPRWLQRPDVFPNHAMEGFWSFWTSTLAAVGVLVGMLLLVFDRWFEYQRRQGIARFSFWGIVMSLAVFAWWFTYQEFPRIDPDLASPPSPRAWSDTLAGWLLYAAVATYLAAKSAQVAVDVTNHQVEISVNRTLVVVGAVFIAVAEVWFLIESVRVMHSISDIFGGGAFFDMMEMFGQMLSWPETLLPLLVLASAVGLLWQSFRHPHATKTIAAISPRRFGYFVVAWAALLAVAIPALWAFAMCYWLGPLVL
ncbi:hypothetical protein NG895_16280 [Aeoliella sp. ICT_H6.2]|uniref:Uncharacterized protein n=1 Tax=Aeoliella straminimaris TaxID=2954799 RepID=A0A9X2FFQ5_9BACT|nr:hypothetical protein [Aeoliella straminimaris]MCO6045469.1 hypothetical protein [Aeoliella straminimaris]